ncbi:hypothetical protein [Algoriphagus namhaensis]
MKNTKISYLFGGLIALGVSSCAMEDADPTATTDVLGGGGSPAEFVDIDYSFDLSTSDHNSFVIAVNEGGVFNMYRYNSEGSAPNDRQLLASSANDGKLSNFVGQAFGPNISGKGNDFVFGQDVGSKVRFWTGEQTASGLKYHQRNKFDVNGEFIDVDYSIEFSDVEHNAFIVAVQNGADVDVYRYNSENAYGNKDLIATTSGGKNGLLQGLVGQAFGPDVANKGNDFAFVRDVGSSLQVWTGEQNGGSLKYHTRNRFNIPGEFVDIDYAEELSTSGYNAFVITVNDGGLIKTYQYNTENNTAGHKTILETGDTAKLLADNVGIAFGPDLVGKGNDFAYAKKLSPTKLQFWIGEQTSSELKFHQRRKFEIGS